LHFPSPGVKPGNWTPLGSNPAIGQACPVAGFDPGVAVAGFDPGVALFPRVNDVSAFVDKHQKNVSLACFHFTLLWISVSIAHEFLLYQSVDWL
jgi:hypothetical protein